MGDGNTIDISEDHIVHFFPVGGGAATEISLSSGASVQVTETPEQIRTAIGATPSLAINLG
jgi:hypothetical protein